MRILVLGAGGRTGRLVVERALEAGHEVTAFVRDPAKARVDERARLVNGEARNVDDLRAALKGQDAAVSAIAGGERRLMEDFARTLVEAMRAEGLTRVVVMSTFIATPNYRATGMMRLFPRLVRGMTADDRAGIEILESSGLDWTIVYATLLKNKPAAGYRIVRADEIVTGRDRVNRADAADCLLAALDDRSTIGQSLLITGL